MSEQENRKSGGGKLTRSETVTVRLDPKLRYLAELAARKQRRTLSSFIEWAVEDSLRQVQLHQGSGFGNDESQSVADVAGALWDLDASDRLIKLAERYPDLLTYEEQRVWKAIHQIVAVPKDGKGSTMAFLHAGKVDPYAVRVCWQDLLAYAEGRVSEDDVCASMCGKLIPF